MAAETPGFGRTPRERAREIRRELILETATRLFYERGVHEVGMEELVAATGLSKPAVYRIFPSKEALIGSYLHRLGDTILGMVDEDRRRLGPAEALHAVLRAVEEDLHRETFRGCPFNNASVEFPDPDHPARVAARAYRRGLHSRLAELAGELVGDVTRDARRDATGVAVSIDLADQLAVLVDGAYVSSVHLGPDGPTRSALALGHRLIDQAAR